MTYIEAINKLEYIERLITNPSSFTSAEIKEKPTDGSVVKALKKKVQAEKDDTSWQSTYEIERDKVRDRDRQIAQLDKTIQSLEIKNNKLLNNYKQILNHLANARQLVSHLQTDLVTEKQDKVHIQKELNDALTVLNKPTSEMETQTDLTAEQITQMEKDIETKKDELVKLVKDQKEQTKEYVKKDQELVNLQTKYDMEVRSKEELVRYLNFYRRQSCIDLTSAGYIYEENGVEMFSSSGFKLNSKEREELNKTFIEIIKQSNYPYSFIIYLDGKLPFVFPKDKLVEQRLIIKTVFPSKKKVIEVKRGDKLWKEQPTPDKLHTNQIFNPNYGTRNGHFYLDFISNSNIEIKVN